MKKVIEIYFEESLERDEKHEIKDQKTFGHYPTGLIIVTEDGKRYRQQSTDPLMPYEEIKEE